MFRAADLIEEIKKKPSLWDSAYKQNADRDLRGTQWQEVGQALFDDWDTLSSSQRNDRLFEIKKKWKNIRDYYRKESKRWKGKKYMYKDVLKFLDKPAGVRNTKSTEVLKKKPPMENEMTIEPMKAVEEVPLVEIPEAQVQAVLNVPEVNGNCSDNDYPSARRKLEEDDNIDEDKSFLLSLLPEMRRLTGRQKMDFKISVLSDLRAARYSEECTLVKNEVVLDDHL